MEKEYVLPYITGGRLPVIILRPEIEWQRSALDLLREINTIWDSNSAVQDEYLIAAKIVALWYIIQSNLSDESEKTFPADLIRRQRLQFMLSFIYEHFSEDITLERV